MKFKHYKKRAEIWSQGILIRKTRQSQMLFSVRNKFIALGEK